MSFAKALGRRLILVEPTPTVREQRRRDLEQFGHTVTALAQCDEALSWLRAEPPPDLILIAPVEPDIHAKDFRQSLMLDPRLARIPVVVFGTPGLLPDPGAKTWLVPPPADPSELNLVVTQFARARKPPILLVDDNAGVLAMLEQALVYFGFQILPAAGGHRAAEIFRQDPGSIDLVLLDVQMAPLDGPHTLAALREIDPRVRVVFMSGNTGRYSSEDLLAAGAVRVIAKPFELVGLTEEIWKILEAPSPADSRAPAGP